MKTQRKRLSITSLIAGVIGIPLSLLLILLSLLMSLSLPVTSRVRTAAMYNEPENKKGILVSSMHLLDEVYDLGCRQLVFNIPINYAFSDHLLSGIDIFLDKLCEADITVTAIILNPYQPDRPRMVREYNPASNYYAFNTIGVEPESYLTQAATALASRYKDKISNWIIGNEINNCLEWNFFVYQNLEKNIQNYAKGFRIFYDQIKAYNPDARVFIPFDYRWNFPNADPMYSVLQFLPALNMFLRDTDYGIAWHAYPEMLKNPNFMRPSPNITHDVSTRIINLQNMDVLIEYMKRPSMLSPSGNVRHLILSEQGFNSAMGEELQAEYLKQAYIMARDNPYVEGFLLSRMVDAPSEMAEGMYFGLFYADTHMPLETPTKRKLAYDIYKSLE